MHVLQELLGPVSVREFLQTRFTRLPFAMPDQAARYTTDFAEADFAAMVESPHAVVRVVRDGRLIRDQARLSWAQAEACYRDGHTLLVRHAERASAKVRAVAEAFALFFHAPVDIQVYLTPDQSQAFGWHYDLEEVFIIQIRGCKEYTIRQNTLNRWPVWGNMPSRMDYGRETSRLRLTCRLEAGDWLYIPSGWWHIADTQAASVHLSIGVMPVVNQQVFEFFKQHLAHTPFWCQRLAWVPSGDVDSPERCEQARKLWEDMRTEVDKLFSRQDIFDAFMGYLVDDNRVEGAESSSGQA